MVRRLSLRVATFMALLGVLALLATGCVFIFEGSIEIRPSYVSFLQDFVAEIGHMDAENLAEEFYGSYVYVEDLTQPEPGRLLSRDEIQHEWEDYFSKYHINDSSIGTVNRRYTYEDGDVFVEVVRYETRQARKSDYQEKICVIEEYQLDKINQDRGWRIHTVRVVNWYVVS